MFDPGYQRTFNDSKLDESMINVPMREQSDKTKKSGDENLAETKIVQQQQLQQQQQRPPIDIKDTSLSSLVKTASRHKEALEIQNKRAQQRKKEHKERYGF